MSNEKDYNLESAIKLFIGIQLIAENGEEVCSSSFISGKNKMIVNNLTKRCLELEQKLWNNMSDEQVKELNRIVKLIEDEI